MRLLRDERGQPLRMPQREPESDRRAEVHQVIAKSPDAELANSPSTTLARWSKV
jgi:hypothetical protein